MRDIEYRHVLDSRRTQPTRVCDDGHIADQPRLFGQNVAGFDIAVACRVRPDSSQKADRVAASLPVVVLTLIASAFLKRLARRIWARGEPARKPLHKTWSRMCRCACAAVPDAASSPRRRGRHALGGKPMLSICGGGWRGVWWWCSSDPVMAAPHSRLISGEFCINDKAADRATL